MSYIWTASDLDHLESKLNSLHATGAIRGIDLAQIIACINSHRALLGICEVAAKHLAKYLTGNRSLDAIGTNGGRIHLEKRQPQEEGEWK